MEISSLFIPVEASLHLDKKITNEELLDKIDKLHDITNYMSQTIDDFKNFFTSEKEKVNFRISEQINTSVNIIASSLKLYKIDLDIIIKNNPIVYGYKNEYSQVLINILTNAKDMLIQRNIANPKIIISIEQRNNNLIVSIIDNAKGITVFPIEKIFEPFYTSGKVNGSGIGLFMSKLIVENNMNGSLNAKNYESGAKFIISIPIK